MATEAAEKRIERKLALIIDELKELRLANDEIVGIDVAMEILGMKTPRALYAALRESDKTEHPIPRYKPGKVWLFKRRELLAYIDLFAVHA